MNSQVLTGGKKLEETPQFINALELRQNKLSKDFDIKIQEFEKEKEQIKEEKAEVDVDQRGNILANTSDYKTSIDGVFSAGDMRRGQSLVVWAIREGRQCARSVDKYLMGNSKLPA